MVRLYLSTVGLRNAVLWGLGSGLLMWHTGPLPLSRVGDAWSLRFYGLLSLISSAVLLWSRYYIDADPHFRRFLALVIAFVMSMILVIFLSTLYGCLIGWDGLGVTSFLLVLYYKNRKALGGGLLTALSNRVGDACLLALLGLTLHSVHARYLPLVLLIVTACTKSAQYPFRRWLPAAIAAPTPASALVHSSTLVTAGIYLLLRFNHQGTE